MFSFLVISVVLGVVILASLMYVPVIRGEEAFFGVRVSPEFYQGEGKRLLRQYYFWLIMTWVEIEIIAIVVSLLRPQTVYARMAWLILFLPAAQILYIIYYQKVKPYALVEENQKFASAIRNRRLADYTRPWLEIIITLLIITPIPLLAYFYPSLPDRIPVHWDIRGVPNRWAKKSFGSVFSVPIMMIYLQGLFLLIKHGFMQLKMTLPADHTKEYLQLKEEALRINTNLMDSCRLMLAVIMSSFSYSIILTAHDAQQQSFIIAIVLGLSVLMVAAIAYFIYRMIDINQKLRATTGRTYVQRQTDAERWYWGGMLYYNPDDPALWVEKLVGIGYTMNMGNKRVYLYLGYLILLPILLRLMLRSS